MFLASQMYNLFWNKAPQRASLIVFQNNVDKSIIAHFDIANAPKICDQFFLLNKLIVFNTQTIQGACLQTSNE